MNPSEFMSEQRKFLVETFQQARAYLNVILIAGYAGLFALWTTFQDRLSSLSILVSGLLACVSIMLFVAWELYSMVKRQQAVKMLRMMVDQPSRFEKGFPQFLERFQATAARLERGWWATVIVTTLAGMTAYLVILSSLAHDLIMRYAPILVPEEMQMLIHGVWLSVGVVLGAIFSGIIIRGDAWYSRRKNRSHFAATLSHELDTSQELVEKLVAEWKKNSLVDGELISEIAYSRQAFDRNRDALHILDIPELQSRLNEYYRQSYALLTKIENDRNYQLVLLRDPPSGESGLDPTMELKRVEGEIAERLDRLHELRADAKELSLQLQSRI